MSAEPTNEHPYLVRISIADPMHHGTGITDLTTIYRLQAKYGAGGMLAICLQQLSFTFREVSNNMGGLYTMLQKLPQDEPVPKVPRSLLLSYLGNGAKKKLAELSTPAAIIAWLKADPTEVLRTMNVWLPEPRTPEQMDELMKRIESRKAPPPITVSPTWSGATTSVPYMDAATNYTVRVDELPRTRRIVPTT